MNKGLWVVVAATGLAVGSCGSNHGTPTGSAPTSGAAPSDFVDFVNQQLQSQPPFGSTPAQTTSLTTDLGIDNSMAFTTPTFGTGDVLPAGTNQAALACTQAGQAACNPTTSADLNSNLN